MSASTEYRCYLTVNGDTKGYFWPSSALADLLKMDLPHETKEAATLRHSDGLSEFEPEYGVRFRNGEWHVAMYDEFTLTVNGVEYVSPSRDHSLFLLRTLPGVTNEMRHKATLKEENGRVTGFYMDEDGNWRHSIVCSA